MYKVLSKGSLNETLGRKAEDYSRTDLESLCDDYEELYDLTIDAAKGNAAKSHKIAVILC